MNTMENTLQLLAQARDALQNADLSAIGQSVETFSQMLMRLLDERGMTMADLSRQASIDRRILSKIRSNTVYIPRKYTIVACAVGMKLTLEETQELLRTAGFTLSRSIRTDVVITYAITHGLCDVLLIEKLLSDLDLPSAFFRQ